MLVAATRRDIRFYHPIRLNLRRREEEKGTAIDGLIE
jgi:hypothetical protein